MTTARQGGVTVLVLSRARDETIVFVIPPSGETQEIEFTVTDIRGDKVRLGTNAGRHIQVHRKEVWKKIQEEEQTGQEGTLS